jgi:hypothetical protein
MTFDGPSSPAVLMSGGGTFGFHFGIDISAPDGTPVYPVRSGTATVRGEIVRVDSGDGFAAEYWHLAGVTVRTGQTVIARTTVLGRVRRGYEHVHFSECRRGTWVNPLAPGHLTPYRDTTTPRVTSIAFRSASTGAELLPETVAGRVDIVAHADDSPSLRVPGMWRDLPVAPALVTWRVVRARDGGVVLGRQVAVDFRRTIPANATFWRFYARGSRQNMTQFASRRAWWEPGVYRYRLARAGLDTKRLPNGIYRVVVTATDTAGNAGSAAQVFIVRNGSPV